MGQGQPCLNHVNGSSMGKKYPVTTRSGEEYSELIKSDVHTTHKNIGLLEIFVVSNICILQHGM